MTSDNISPHNLMDIKRVAFETKPVNSGVKISNKMATPVQYTQQQVRSAPKVNREDIATIVDKFLSKKLSEAPAAPDKIDSKPADRSPTVIHRVADNASASESPVDFVNEDDVRTALTKDKKIYINKKTIITPAAKDLGDEKEVFTRV